MDGGCWGSSTRGAQHLRAQKEGEMRAEVGIKAWTAVLLVQGAWGTLPDSQNGHHWQRFHLPQAAYHPAHLLGSRVGKRGGPGLSANRGRQGVHFTGHSSLPQHMRADAALKNKM